MAYDKSTLRQTGIFATVTTGNGGGGVWHSGRPPLVDGSGSVYVVTGNGFNGTGYDGVHNFSESVLKLNPAAGLGLVDWFTASDWPSLDNQDLDLTSSGPLLVPGTSLIATGGKTGILYLLNTAKLGKIMAGDSGAIQKFRISAGEFRGGPVYWQRSAASGGPLLYNWGVSDALKAFAFSGTTFATSPGPGATGNVANQIWPGGTLALSANGETAGTGVLWATVATSGDPENAPPVPGELYAFDAGNVATQLWNSNMNATRDAVGNYAKFVPPLVANGRVYVATWSNKVVVYGLIAPKLSTVSPASGSAAGATPVTLTGQNFTSGTKVTFGGAAATSVAVVSATQMTANTPQHAPATVNVAVTNPNGLASTASNAFKFVAPPPTLSSVSPTSGTTAGGTAVNVTGQNFASGATVAFGGTAATSVVVLNATQITANTPAHAQGSVNVVVTNTDGQSATLTSGFTFGARAPTVSSASPTTGRTSGGTVVTLNGNNFVSGAGVTFGGVPATSVSVMSPTRIAAGAPAHKPGGVSIVVTNPDLQKGTLANGFTYHPH
jgi:hypothetical protein